MKYEEGVDGQAGMWSHERSHLAYGAQPEPQYCSYETVDEQMHDCKEEGADDGFNTAYPMQYPQQLSGHTQPWDSTVCSPWPSAVHA